MPRKISIDISNKKNNSLSMKYADNGKGCDTKFTEAFGFELTGLLTEQLNGTYSYNSADKGANSEFIFGNP